MTAYLCPDLVLDPDVVLPCVESATDLPGFELTPSMFVDVDDVVVATVVDDRLKSVLSFSFSCIQTVSATFVVPFRYQKRLFVFVDGGDSHFEFEQPTSTTKLGSCSGVTAIDFNAHSRIKKNHANDVAVSVTSLVSRKSDKPKNRKMFFHFSRFASEGSVRALRINFLTASPFRQTALPLSLVGALAPKSSLPRCRYHARTIIPLLR